MLERIALARKKSDHFLWYSVVLPLVAHKERSLHLRLGSLPWRKMIDYQSAKVQSPRCVKKYLFQQRVLDFRIMH